MKKYKLLFLLLFVISFTGTAQNNKLPEAIEIKADTATFVDFQFKNWQYIILNKNFQTFEQVKNLPGFITPSDYPQVNKNQQLWLRYKIKNSLPHSLNITIPQVNGIQNIYVLANNKKVKHFKTGYRLPYSQRDGYKRIGHVPVTIPKGAEVTIYESYDNAYGSVSAGIGIEKNVVRDFYVNNDLYFLGLISGSVLFGIFFMSFIINVFFYYVVREKVYLMYSLTLFFSAFTYFHRPLNDFFFREYPLVMDFIYFLNTTLLMAFFVITALMFLRVNKNNVLVYKTVLAINIIFVAADTIKVFVGAGSFTPALTGFTGILRSALPVIIVIIIIVDIIKKRSTARIFLVAVLPFVLIFSSAFLLEWTFYMQLLTNITVVWAVIVMSWILFNRYKYLQAENARQALEKERLAREKEEERNELIARQNEILELQVAERTAELQQSLENLKLTQNQLIQSEKMASLGELTAGIAHEIQNPLNFVNNFSDVSVELLQELKEELGKGDIDEATAIADDVTQNLQKIAHHGRRADGIVRGMLQHSRASSGQKEPTDINALADEYLRLAYHGLRAKDKSFNADLVTNFAEGLPKVNIIPQDMGRVLLNLFTNAFYATQEKSKQWSVASGQSQFSGYKPAVSVTTQIKDNSLEIIVKDNGTGIPDAIKDKILQPFFTTKPTGEGTGLGLSLSYDIVVKGHGGSIAINSQEGEFSEFIIKLSI